MSRLKKKKIKKDTNNSRVNEEKEIHLHARSIWIDYLNEVND